MRRLSHNSGGKSAEKNATKSKSCSRPQNRTLAFDVASRAQRVSVKKIHVRSKATVVNEPYLPAKDSAGNGEVGGSGPKSTSPRSLCLGTNTLA